MQLMCQIPPASFPNKLAVSSAAGVLPLVFIIPDGQKHPSLFLIVYPVPGGATGDLIPLNI
jgi:hypothetical protein